MADARSDRSCLPPFVVLSAIWGASFLFIKVGDRAFEPLQVAFGRCLLGAIALLGALALRREPLPRGRDAWLHLMVIAVLFNSVPFALFAWGGTGVSSVVAGIWNATTPLNTLLVALAVLPDERPERARVLGLATGFAGVVVVLGPWSGLGGRLLGNLACYGAAACYGLGFVYTRRYLAGRRWCSSAWRSRRAGSADRAANEVDDLLGRGARGEDLGHAQLLELGYVLGRDRPAHGHHHVLGALLPEQVHDAGDERHVGAGEDRQADRVRVLLQHGLGDLLWRLVKTGVDHLHPRVAQGPCDP